MKVDDYGTIEGRYEGSKTRIPAGEYDLVDYTETGGSYAQQKIRLDKAVEGLVVEYVGHPEGVYNVAVRLEDSQRVVFLAVENEKVRD